MKFLILILIPMILVAQSDLLKESSKKLIQIDTLPVSLKLEEKLKPDSTSNQIKINLDKGVNERIIDIEKLKPLIEEKPPVGHAPGPVNPNFSCNIQILQSYGFKGQTNASVDKNKHCPAITQNCCTDHDADIALEMYKNDNIFRIEQWYQTYSFMVNYLLGYAHEADILANEYQGQTGKCGEGATTLKNMNTGLTFVKEVQKTFEKSIKTLVSMRTGFYCHICDFNSQNYMFAASNSYDGGSMVISKSSCMKLAKDVAPASFYAITYLKTLAESLSTLIGCKKNLEKDLKIKVPANEDKMINNCYQAIGGVSRLACDSFCGSLKFTAPSAILDGYVHDLYPIFQRVRNYKNSVFKNPELNSFSASLDFDEKVVQTNYKAILLDDRFYRNTGSSSVDFNKFSSSVTEIGGIPVFEVLKDKTFYSYFEHSHILTILGSLVLLLLII